MRIAPCTLEAHGPAILDILNDAILHSTAVYEYEPRKPDSMTGWFADKAAGNYPVIGAFNDDGTLMGFASYGPFRTRAAYKYTVEHSVYVQKDMRGHGVGRRLLAEIIEAARTQEYHLMVGGIDAANETSIRLHTALGFTYAGTIRQAGFKFGRWLDLVFYELILDTPSEPRDG